MVYQLLKKISSKTDITQIKRFVIVISVLKTENTHVNVVDQSTHNNTIASSQKKDLCCAQSATSVKHALDVGGIQLETYVDTVDKIPK
jgi:16S rRNA G527 N7-methylase RsmG